jgi:hypothetical protein
VNARHPDAPHQSSPSELRERLAAERRGLPFLLFRDAEGEQRIVDLPDGVERVALGRGPECDVCLAWDAKASRLHAQLERVGTDWVLTDDGLSRNGTFVRGHRLSGRRRLADADIVRIGDTAIVFHRPGAAAAETTQYADDRELAVGVTESQRRVLVALCRPFKGGAADASPTTNPAIAAELFLSVGTVKTHMRALFTRFGIDELPQLEKRRRLVALAFATGLVSERDLDHDG